MSHEKTLRENMITKMFSLRAMMLCKGRIIKSLYNTLKTVLLCRINNLYCNNMYNIVKILVRLKVFIGTEIYNLNVYLK